MYIKNDDTINHTYEGQLILPGEYHQVSSADWGRWADNTDLAKDVADGLAVVSTTNDVNGEFANIVEGLRYLNKIDGLKYKTEEEIPAGGAANEFIGFQFTATKNTTTTYDFKIPVDFHLRNGDIECVDNVARDYVSFKIVDVDGIAYPAGTVLKQYVHNINIPTTGYYEFPTNKKTVLNLKDFYLRVDYVSVGTTNDVTVLCNMRGMDS